MVKDLGLSEEEMNYILYVPGKEYQNVRQALTQSEMSNIQDKSKIVKHPNVPFEVYNEVLTSVRKLKEPIENWDKRVNYYDNSFGRCHPLSIIFQIRNPMWDLKQGQYKGESYKHSWLQKDGIIYDPAFRIMAISRHYYDFFDLENTYSYEDTIKHLKQVGMFTHFRQYINMFKDNDPRISQRELGTIKCHESAMKLIETFRLSEAITDRYYEFDKVRE